MVFELLSLLNGGTPSCCQQTCKVSASAGIPIAAYRLYLWEEILLYYPCCVVPGQRASGVDPPIEVGIVAKIPCTSLEPFARQKSQADIVISHDAGCLLPVRPPTTFWSAVASTVLLYSITSRTGLLFCRKLKLRVAWYDGCPLRKMLLKSALRSRGAFDLRGEQSRSVYRLTNEYESQAASVSILARTIHTLSACMLGPTSEGLRHASCVPCVFILHMAWIGSSKHRNRAGKKKKMKEEHKRRQANPFTGEGGPERRWAWADEVKPGETKAYVLVASPLP